jgi:glyoxylase-like metal-dependent hydrolase (beta-lactamase superfamily II)
METLEFAAGIRVHHARTGPFNWYIVSREEGLTLVDAGLPGHYTVFLECLRALGRGIRDLKGILLTHAHADHTGFAETLRRSAGVPVYIHRDDADSCRRILQLPWRGLLANAWRPSVAAMFVRAARDGVFRMARVTETVAVQDGDTLDLPGTPRVIHAPGHTPGSAAFFLPEAGVLFSGDAVATRNILTGAHGAPQILPRVINQDDRQARRAPDRFGDLGSVTVLPGHGRVWRGRIGEDVHDGRRIG